MTLLLKISLCSTVSPEKRQKTISASGAPQGTVAHPTSSTL